VPTPTKPTLVVVSGPGGVGKTTFAHKIAQVIGCPAICRDEIKEGMVHATPGFQPAVSDPLTMRTLGVFFDVLRLLLEAGVTVVAEAAFQDKVWRPRLEPLTGLCELRIVHLTVDPAVAYERRVRRLADVPTRKAHADVSALQDPGAFVRVDLPVPSITVDTTNGYHPSLQEIAAFVDRR
jgi:predicted kinase